MVKKVSPPKRPQHATDLCPAADFLLPLTIDREPYDTLLTVRPRHGRHGPIDPSAELMPLSSLTIYVNRSVCGARAPRPPYGTRGVTGRLRYARSLQ